MILFPMIAFICGRWWRHSDQTNLMWMILKKSLLGYLNWLNCFSKNLVGGSNGGSNGWRWGKLLLMTVGRQKDKRTHNQQREKEHRTSKVNHQLPLNRRKKLYGPSEDAQLIIQKKSQQKKSVLIKLSIWDEKVIESIESTIMIIMLRRMIC